jgi:hypothetical protein
MGFLVAETTPSRARDFPWPSRGRKAGYVFPPIAGQREWDEILHHPEINKWYRILQYKELS